MTLWAVALGAIAVLFLFVIPVVGAILFRPQRARNVKRVELQSEIIVQQHITELAVFHPEIVKLPRLDRHPFYIAPHVGVWSYAWCIFVGAPVTNNVASLGAVTRYTMAGCFLVGSSLALIGVVMGARVGRWRFVRRVQNHATSPLLGDDITLPYWLGICGLVSIAVSMAIYSSTSFKTTAGSLGGWLTAVLAAACLALIPMLHKRIREFDRHDTALIAEVMTRNERERHANAG